MTMRGHLVAAATLLAILSAPAALRAGEEAPAAVRYFEHGMTHLRQGELEAALAAFRQASEAAPDDARYSRQAMLVKRVIGIRKYVDENDVSAKWERMVVALHTFYMQHQSYRAALNLAGRAHRLLKNGASEARYAEALLASGQDADAVALLAARVGWSRNARHVVFRGVALARLGSADEARRLVTGLEMPKDADPTLLRDRARLDALLGEHPAALRRLQGAFAGTPDTALADMKNSVLQCPDFASLFGTPAFQKVMQTPSDVKTTSCSGGSDCGSCPKRGGCKGKK